MKNAEITESNYNPDLVYNLSREDAKQLNLAYGGLRLIDPKHVATIKAAIKRGDRIPPIEVNIKQYPDGSRHITDGQHRFAAATELWNSDPSCDFKLRTLFTEYSSKEDEEAAVIIRNTTAKNWKLKDFTDYRLGYNTSI